MKITIDNYEMFYLDFLEGNLNEIDNQLFIEFLEIHPELKLENHEFAPVAPDLICQLDFLEKALMKSIDLNNIELHNESIETLIIAQKEGLLSNQKSNEVNSYISTDSDLIRLKNEYALVHLIPNRDIIFDNKLELKKKARIIPFWTIGATVAASLLLLISISIFSGKNKNINFAETSVRLNKNMHDEDQLVRNLPSEINENNSKNLNESKVLLEENKKNLDSLSMPVLTENLDEILLSSLSTHEIEHDFEITILKYNIESNLSKTQKSIKKIEKEVLLANYVEKSISKIADKLSDITERDIDFKVFNSSSMIASGFYLKVGKFEVMRSISK